MKTLSVCLIVRNEEKTLEKCLKSVQPFADEIVIVDTGSTDSSKIIAKKFTDKVYDFEWQDDFSLARNFSFSKATGDYIMWLDADDVVLCEDSQKIIDFKNFDSCPDVLMMKYVTAYDENYKSEFCFYRERILRRAMKFKWCDPVHEVITPRGKIEYADICVYHTRRRKSVNPRNLQIYQKFIAKGNRLSPRQQFYYARELYFNSKFEEAIREFSKFLASHQGWKENNLEACLNLARCYLAKGEVDNALTTLFGSFCYGAPRSEILCEIGAILISLKRYDEAVVWFKLAKGKPDIKSGAFVVNDCYDFIPNLELCVCYYNLGRKSIAKRYHELCKKQKPNHPSVIFNEKYFS